MNGTHFYPSRSVSGQGLTQDQQEQLDAAFDKVEPLIRAAFRSTIAFQIKKEEASLTEELDLLEVQSAECHKNLAEADKKVAEAGKKLADTRRKTAEASNKVAEADRKLAEIAQQEKNLVTNYFHWIFVKEKKELSPEQISEIFQKYLADNQFLIIEQSSRTGKKGFLLKDIKAIEAYLNDHPNTNALDFRHFGQNVYIVSELAKLLVKSPNIKGVVFNTDLPQEDKNLLEDAKKARGGKFIVKYEAKRNASQKTT